MLMQALFEKLMIKQTGTCNHSPDQRATFASHSRVN